ncbi:MAG TPA: rod shape-determining protein MreC [Candidatus Krumholzibacteria bacterium]|nr:rod shape-determining protein MreC [Candidatus Krumholzibacteria bacterium]HRX50317.1 rod shape-determining protein MreC [Candidatus Krumholzibacteria bacterium]
MPAAPQSRAMERLALGVCAFSALALLALPLNQKTAVADVLSRVLTSPWTRTVRFAEGLVDLRGENARLHAQVRAMEVDAAAADRLRRERDRLRRALGFADQDPARLVPCEVERLQVDPTATLVKIHAPEPVAWREHQPVMTDAGLVGRVVRAAAPNAAWVELITSPGFAVCCQVERTGLAGILRPQGGVFELTMVGRDEDIVATDLLITSDLPTQAGGDAEAIPSMPRGLPVARVSRVGLHKWKLFKSVTVEPLADLSELDIVFVVLGRGDWLVADGEAPAAPAEAAP